MQLTFHGAAGEVTGSCFMLDTGTTRFLVDCGMFQGGLSADWKNAQFPKFDTAGIDFVLLTHAHLDHSGLLPRLVARGFHGPIYATRATIDLLEVMLRDSAHIQAKEAEWKLRHPERTDNDELGEILYDMEEVEAALALMHPVQYDAYMRLRDGISCRFLDAGHIIGSAIIEVWIGDRKVVFSGDLGQPGRPILHNPTPVAHADVLLIESTYGNRRHKNLHDTLDEFVAVIENTLHQKHGNIVMPAFTVGRTQEILYLLIDLTRQRRLKNLRVYVDSPMALAATEITMRHIALFNQEARALLAWGQERRKEMPDIRFVESVEESMAINDIKSGAIIISASGMCDAGRIKHHLRHNLPRPECSIVITGFQAEGTLGRRLVDGAKLVRLFGQEIPVRASIHTIGGLSAHADQAALLEWLENFQRAPQQTYVIHGEAGTADTFAQAVRKRLGWMAVTPAIRGTVDID